jgi:hypothetical protein
MPDEPVLVVHPTIDKKNSRWWGGGADEYYESSGPRPILRPGLKLLYLETSNRRFECPVSNPLSLITILSTLRMPTPTSRVTPPPITTPDDLDRSLLDSSPPEGTELREATSLVNSMVRSSTLITPIKRYIERSGSVLERTTSENALLRKELTEARELLQVCKERKKGKRVAVTGKFVFNTKEILELVEEAEAEALKGKSKKRRTTRATTPKLEDKDEEDIENSIYESESDCIIVASSESNPRQGVRSSV